jgi:hypothetical protein
MVRYNNTILISSLMSVVVRVSVQLAIGAECTEMMVGVVASLLTTATKNKGKALIGMQRMHVERQQ